MFHKQRHLLVTRSSNTWALKDISQSHEFSGTLDGSHWWSEVVNTGPRDRVLTHISIGLWDLLEAGVSSGLADGNRQEAFSAAGNIKVRPGAWAVSSLGISMYKSVEGRAVHKLANIQDIRSRLGSSGKLGCLRFRDPHSGWKLRQNTWLYLSDTDSGPGGHVQTWDLWWVQGVV